jgi:hypothetical protein
MKAQGNALGPDHGIAAGGSRGEVGDFEGSIEKRGASLRKKLILVASSPTPTFL